MVLTSSGVEAGEVRLLPPALPALLISDRGLQGRSRYVCRPRADATTSSSSGDLPSGAGPSTSKPAEPLRFSLPAPSRTTSWGVGLGVGGAAFVSQEPQALGQVGSEHSKPTHVARDPALANWRRLGARRRRWRCCRWESKAAMQVGSSGI